MEVSLAILVGGTAGAVAGVISTLLLGLRLRHETGQFKIEVIRQEQDTRAAVERLTLVVAGRSGPLSSEGGAPVAVLEADEDDTSYLLANPANAERLLTSISRLEAGGGTVRDLVE